MEDINYKEKYEALVAKRKITRKKYYDSHGEQLRAYHNQYYKSHYVANPEFLAKRQAYDKQRYNNNKLKKLAQKEEETKEIETETEIKEI